MKKIIVLVMSCNLPFFTEEERVVREESYGKAILSGEYPGIDFWSYTASTDGKYHVDLQKHRLQVPADDSLYGTYDKTRKALLLLKEIGIEYDYILRTNCSSYINCDLLRIFVDNLNDPKEIFASCIYSTNRGSAPEPYDLYALGNAMLLSKFWCDIIQETPITEEFKLKDRTPKEESEKSIYKVDDNAIGFVVNTYAEENNIDKYSIWHSWFNNTSHVFNLDDMIKNKTYMKYIATSVRIYDPNFPREEEFQILRELEKHKVKVSLSNPEIYMNETRKNCDIVHFVNWDTGCSYLFYKKDADDFLYNKVEHNYNFEKYFENLKKEK